MKRMFSGVGAVKQHLENQIDRCNTRIATARKVLVKELRGNVRQAATEIEAYTARRRAYQDALKALNEMGPSPGGLGDPRSIQVAKNEVERVKSALKLIYETTQHGGHDISDGKDWAAVEAKQKPRSRF